MAYIFNSSIEFRTPLARGSKRINKRGARTKAWEKAWSFLKPRLESAGRTRCEFGFIAHHCGGILTPAHSKKRREMQGADIYHVSLACLNVHRILDEQMTHGEMESAVMRGIENHGGLILPDRY